MEDEECLPENSPLNLYLQGIGYSDVQVIEKIKSSPTNLKLELTKPKLKCHNIETLDEDIIKQIEIIISTQMLFEEDVSDVEKLLSNFKVVKNGMLKSMFQGVFGVAVIFFGLCLFWIIGGFAFLIVSSFYAYNAAYYLNKKHFTQKQLKKLASVLQSNFLMLKNTVKFIEDNSKCAGLNNTSVKEFTNHIKEGFDFYNNFKSDFFMSVKEMVATLTKSTHKLISKFPLCEYMENPEYYLCNNLNENLYESCDILKLYQIYLLVQSEFLQRLILSLIPNVKLCSTDNINELNKIVRETCLNLLKIKNKLNKKFKFIFLNGVHWPKSKVELKVPAKIRIPSVNYVEEFASNIRDTSNSFQNLLIKSRIIEENIKSEKIPENIENELVDMQNDLNACLRNIEDGFILLKKATATNDKKSTPKIKEDDIQNTEEKCEAIPVGFTDLDPKIEDEIFEAYFSSENVSSDLSSIDDWDFENRLKKKLEKEYSKNVMKELKLKIVERAKKWEEREAELLKRKKLNENESEVEKEVLPSATTPDCNTNKFIQCKRIFDDKNSLSEAVEIQDDNTENKLIQENFKISNEKNKNLEEGFNYNDQKENSLAHDLINKTLLLEKLNNTESDNCTYDSPISYLGGMDKNFLTDLTQARQKIFMSDNTEEEFFCDSEDSSDEKFEN